MRIRHGVSIAVMHTRGAGRRRAPPSPGWAVGHSEPSATGADVTTAAGGDLDRGLLGAWSMSKPPANLRVAGGPVGAMAPLPLPAAVVNAPGGMRIPTMALSAYRKAEQAMAVAAPGCGMSWNLLAGIGRIESSHANGGATDAGGTAIRPIYGPVLDGSLPGNEVIVQSNVRRARDVRAGHGPDAVPPGHLVAVCLRRRR